MMRDVLDRLRSQYVALRRQDARLEAWQALRDEVASARTKVRERTLTAKATLDDVGSDIERTWERIGQAFWIESDLESLAVSIEEEIARREDL